MRLDLWSKADDDTILRLYPDFEALAVALPNRTRDAIRVHASAYGLRKQDQKSWSSRDERTLREINKRQGIKRNYMEAFPARSYVQICSKLQKMGLQRRRPPPVLFGVPIIDAVRRRAWDEGVNFRELDAATGGGRYWRKDSRKAATDGISWGRVARAVEYLGGTLNAVWDGADAA